jgi:hypothetical protein
MLKLAVIAAVVGAGLVAGLPVPAAAECAPAQRARCNRLPEPQRIRCLNECPQKAKPGSSSSTGSGSYGKAEIKKKNVPTVKPNKRYD